MTAVLLPAGHDADAFRNLALEIFPINISQQIHMVLFGINLRFGGGSGF